MKIRISKILPTSLSFVILFLGKSEEQKEDPNRFKTIGEIQQRRMEVQNAAQKALQGS